MKQVAQRVNNCWIRGWAHGFIKLFSLLLCTFDNVYNKMLKKKNFGLYQISYLCFYVQFMTKPSQELCTKQYFLSLKTIQRPLTEGHFEPQWIYMHFLLLERSEKQSLYRGFDSISLSRCTWARVSLPRGSTDLYPEGPCGIDTDRQPGG